MDVTDQFVSVEMEKKLNVVPTQPTEVNSVFRMTKRSISLCVKVDEQDLKRFYGVFMIFDDDFDVSDWRIRSPSSQK